MCKSAIKDLSKAPAPKQIGVGAVVGWATGYLTMKVGKMAATAVGGSLLGKLSNNVSIMFAPSGFV